MNRRQKKARARRRSVEWGSEKVLDALANGPHPSRGVLRHGRTWTFYDAEGKPSRHGSLDPSGRR